MSLLDIYSVNMNTQRTHNVIRSSSWISIEYASSPLKRFAILLTTFCVICETIQGQVKHWPNSDLIVSATTKQLVPNESLGVSIDSPLALKFFDAAVFRSPIYRIRIADSAIKLRHTDRVLDFKGVSQLRTQKGNLEVSAKQRLEQLEGDGVFVSNVGVSIAITVKLNGKKYALLSHRDKTNTYMLLSGYVEDPGGDRKKLLWQNVLRELGEELLLVGRDGRAIGIRVADQSPQREGSLVWYETDRYESLTYGPDRLSLITAHLPTYLKNFHAIRQVQDGADEFQAGFQYAQQWNSAQLVFSFECDWNEQIAWAFHAEDQLDRIQKNQLVTMVNRDALVLVELDAQEMLTSHFFNFHNGELVKRDLPVDKVTKLSEAFAPSPLPGVRGFVNKADTPLSGLDLR